MNRTYNTRHYLKLVQRIRSTIPGVGLSTDIIAGFPTENEDDHQMTLDLMVDARFDGAFTFKYSRREKTKAWSMKDSVPEGTKNQRLNEIIEVQREISASLNAEYVGQTVEVLVEGESKKSPMDLCGRTDIPGVKFSRDNISWWTSPDPILPPSLETLSRARNDLPPWITHGYR
jgi:tRNA-2-methylthio-N6-dimethylallyladenosine synthase